MSYEIFFGRSASGGQFAISFGGLHFAGSGKPQKDAASFPNEGMQLK
jgi:hypothetical protein